VRLAVDLGINKVRLTGGEPLLRQDAEELVARIIRIPGISDLAMTTNGFMFAAKARALREAGLRRISFSLDSLERLNFQKMTGHDALNEVLAGIALAQEFGFHPVKVNAVIIRDINDHEIEALAEFAREHGLHCRFIEFMPLDSGRAWLKEMVVPGCEMLGRLQARFDLRPAQAGNPAETAKRWAFPDGRGELGIMAPVSEPFCGHCNRIRLTADGKIRTCLFSGGGARPARAAAGRGGRRRDFRLAASSGAPQGGAPSHRGAGVRPAGAQDELHRADEGSIRDTAPGAPPLSPVLCPARHWLESTVAE